MLAATTPDHYLPLLYVIGARQSWEGPAASTRRVWRRTCAKLPAGDFAPALRPPSVVEHV